MSLAMLQYYSFESVEKILDTTRVSFFYISAEDVRKKKGKKQLPYSVKQGISILQDQ